MNKKSRSLRAGIAVTLLVVALMLGADALGNFRGGAEYNYNLSLTIILTLGALAVTLFAWNVTQYAVKRNK